MSPQTPRYHALAAGDATESSGRHRRPQSLADVNSSAAPAPSRVAAGDLPIMRWSGGTPVAPAPAAHAWSAPPPRRSERHGRHTADAPRRPVTGSHRAPGTLPIESWLLIGKTRQQALLASLVAVGLLLVALPAEHTPAGNDPVNAAAQRAAGANPAKKPATSGKDASTDNGSGQGADQSAPAPSASTTAGPTPVVKPSNDTGRAPNGAGPGHSLRTTGTRAIALTFDDGPDPVQTPKILALLDEYQIKATFCLVGEQAAKHPETVQQIVAAGHTLCNHTWNHSLTIGKASPKTIRADLARTNAAIRAAVPGVAIPYFRAPGGNFTDRLVAVADQDQMASLYWEVDPRDWEHPDGETSAEHIGRVVADIRKHIRPGAIVLSHDFNQPDTIAAYRKLLPWLKENFAIGLPTTASTAPGDVSPTPAETPDQPAPQASSAPSQD